MEQIKIPKNEKELLKIFDKDKIIKSDKKNIYFDYGAEKFAQSNNLTNKGEENRKV